MTSEPRSAHGVGVGGISGRSVAGHLSRLGWTDIVPLERKRLTSVATCHAVGRVGQLRVTRTRTRLAKSSADLDA